jgi:glutaconate CoA-transferase subunit B
LSTTTTEIVTKQERGYTLGELMAASAAREIRDGEVVFVGMRLPLIAFVVAKRTHAPNAVGLFENGVIRSTPAPELIYTMADPPNILGATQCLDMLGVMSLLQSGRVHLGFLGAAEVDRFGNLNSTEVRGPKGLVRLPGSGGACDIASLAQRFVALLEHSKQRLPERVVPHESGKWRWCRMAAASWVAARRASCGYHDESCVALWRGWRSVPVKGSSRSGS